jgi:hypothetical protein
VSDGQRELWRARIFLRSVLPLLKVVLAEQPALAASFRGVNATVQLEATDPQQGRLGASLRFADGTLSLSSELQESPEVVCRFPDLRRMNGFFAGQLVLPALSGFRHPLLLAKTARLLTSLRLLHPQPPPTRPAARALRVKLLLYLVTHAISELHRCDYPPLVDLVEKSPERVYQWSVTAEGIGAYLRMASGRLKAGRGTYPHRQPFVHFVFPDADAALRVLSESGSQMAGLRSGLVQTLGSPEYTRKIGLLMQEVDALLLTG